MCVNVYFGLTNCVFHYKFPNVSFHDYETNVQRFHSVNFKFEGDDLSGQYVYD